ncbi:conserved hypothetical protein [Frankia canadensis]|uniref:Uncharacterized protein n=1 Tax=Frankia canadensis TaxID=1836972 RepID=A0A2I2KR29_9ACTN|nr:hypothetical protein [Frankia canadensis]SNQ48125.1 conserved hypothetical protein [Frankia canadensis]SOU55415.1 conserved hypothetical protein [Frankia canadensis]
MIMFEMPPPPGDVLTVTDLELRSDAAFARHMETYTTGSVLFAITTALPVDQDEQDGGELHAALVRVRAAVDDYRQATRRAWRDAYHRWADMAGVEVDDTALFPDLPTASDTVSGEGQ